MKETHEKTIHGHINLHLRMPLTFKVDAVNEVYEDENGKEYTEEEWEYSVDEILEQYPRLKELIALYKTVWNVEEISIEEC